MFLAKLNNMGKDCWGKCYQSQGPCSWCGPEGYCCTRKTGWKDFSSGCDGSFGGDKRHECALKPGKSSQPSNIRNIRKHIF